MIGFRQWHPRVDGPGIVAKCTHLENPDVDDIVAINLKRMWVEQVWLGPHLFHLCDKCVEELSAMMEIARACIKDGKDKAREQKA